MSIGKLVVCTAAAGQAQEMFDEYERVFRGVGIKYVRHLFIERRNDGKDEKNIRLLEDAGGVFFTSDDQLMITSQMGETPCFQLIQRIYDNSAMPAGIGQGHGFDLRERRPLQPSAKKLEEKIPQMNPRDTDDRQEAE